MAHKNIQSVLQEDRVFPPSAAFAKQATLKAAELRRMHARAADDYVGFWADLAAAQIEWHRPFTIPLDDSRAPNYRWFTDGRLNVSHNCLDVHLATRADKVAIIFEGEPGDVGLSPLVVQGLGHAGQPERNQAVVGGVGQHIFSSQW